MNIRNFAPRLSFYRGDVVMLIVAGLVIHENADAGQPARIRIKNAMNVRVREF